MMMEYFWDLTWSHNHFLFSNYQHWFFETFVLYHSKYFITTKCSNLIIFLQKACPWRWQNSKFWRKFISYSPNLSLSVSERLSWTPLAYFISECELSTALFYEWTRALKNCYRIIVMEKVLKIWWATSAWFTVLDWW